jgi:ribosomal protein L37E
MSAIDGEELLRRVANYFNENVTCGKCGSQSWITGEFGYSMTAGKHAKVKTKVVCRNCGNKEYRTLSHESIRDYIWPA